MQAFVGCTALTNITDFAETPQTLGDAVFSAMNQASCTLYVPEEAVALYGSTAVWQDFGAILPLTSEGIENTPKAVQCTKTVRNGQLLILRNGHTYNATGAEIR